MPDRSPEVPPPGGWVPPPADATREITLPPLPDRPAPAVRPEWTRYVPAAGSSVEAPVEVPAEAPVEAPAPPPRPAVPLDPPTDRLAAPPERARSATLSFRPPPPVQLLKVSVGARRSRGRWLWALLLLVPLAVIVGSGIWLLVLFGVL